MSFGGDAIYLELSDGRQRRLTSGEECVVGSGKRADLLVKGDSLVSRAHARVRCTAEGLFLKDLDSRNGTHVGGDRIREEMQLDGGSAFRIGNTTVAVRTEKSCGPVMPEERGTGNEVPSDGVREDIDTGPVREYREKVFSVVVERLKQQKVAVHQEQDEKEQTRFVRTLLDSAMKEIPPPPALSTEQAQSILMDDLVGFGPLQPFLQDDDIEEIMVNDEKTVFVATKGQTRRVHATFLNREQLLNVIEKIVTPLNKRIDDSQPYVDASLADGSRVNAIIPPLALEGPCLTIRKFRKQGFSVDDLVEYGAMSEVMRDFFRFCVENRLNILISGGTGSGKTTLLNAMSSFIPSTERILTIEDTAELRLQQDHVVRLQTRAANIEKEGEVTIRDLVINALRMRPDRIVVGECRGGEALDMVQAMNTGHDGSLTTAHANSPRDALRRLEVMCLMAGMDLPARAIREQLTSAIDLIVQIARFTDGSRRIIDVTEVVGLQNDVSSLQDIFQFKRTGLDGDGKTVGRYLPTGTVPNFVEKFADMGISVDQSWFREE